ncbi:MAG TPA: 6-phospho-beta-glucosidase [Bacillota bacterium]|nr:6-phospho-beta-glucosidase [Bacillota bacterium]HOL16553.1 6-phospho-beta-glucosidase [Bacillota bacterium]
MKITVIGGGSSYTPELIGGILENYHSFPVSEICLVDIEAGDAKQSAVAGLCRRMIRKAGLDGKVKLAATLDRRAALSGAAFVISQFRAGGLATREKDELLPLPYGIVGQETTGPGGFAAALRHIPLALELAADMERLCPDAFLINFTNPSGIITEALQRQSPVKCAGLCNIPLTMQKMMAAFLDAAPERLELIFTGLNHLSWVTRVLLDGSDVTGRILSAPETALFWAHDFPEIGLEEARMLLQSLGALPSPYLLYYYFPEQTFAAAKKKAGEGKNRAREVIALEEELFQLYRDPAVDEKPDLLSRRGGAFYSETAVSLMRALCGSGSAKQVVLNVKNGSAIPDLPANAVIETNCLIGGGKIRPLSPGPLPAAFRGLVQQVKAYEQLTVEAAVSGDKNAAYLALLNHPLVRGAGPARALLDEILKENAPYLPQFR